MGKIKRFVRCPVCDQLMTILIDDSVKSDRWPMRLEGEHEGHGYVVLLDSQYAITEIKKRASTRHNAP